MIMKRKSVMQQAVDFVVKYEKQKRRNPKVLPQGHGYDVESSGLKIEVKGASTPSKRTPFVRFNQYNFNALRKENNFRLYIVCNISRKPELLILNRDEILKRLKFEYGWEIPLRKKDFENK